MNKVVILALSDVQFSSFHPSGGGKNRTYQIQWDCEQVLSPEDIVVVSNDHWRKSLIKGSESHSSSQENGYRKNGELINILRNISFNLRRRLKHLKQPGYDFLQVLSPTHSSRLEFSNPAFIEYYKKVLEAIDGPIICVNEHYGYSDIVKLNNELGIPTVSVFHNIESLDSDGAFDLRKTLPTWSRLGNFLEELSVLSESKERLFISKVETALVSGIGYKSEYYPYRPVGVIAEWLRSIRKKRATYDYDRDKSALFLMLGSAVHTTTGDGFRWFLEQASIHGLPSQLRIDVVGLGTEELDIHCKGVENIQCRGWVSQELLEELLVSAKAVLVPQPYGFGALTRLAEFAMANIPVIVSEYATYATEIPFTAKLVKDDWESWYYAMEEILGYNNSDLTYDVQESTTGRQSALQQSLLRLIDDY